MFPIVNINRNLGIVQIEGEDVLTIAVSEIEGYKKYYLGQTGIAKIISFLKKSGMAKLKPGWENARFAVVAEDKTGCVICTTVEYQDGTVVIITGFPAGKADKNKADIDKSFAGYIQAEFRTPFVKGLKSWEEIPSGAAIKEAFTSRETNTGLWGQEVPVVNFDCNDCLKCYIQCPDESIYRNPITGIAELVDPTKCKACGICADVCNKDAITMVGKGDVKAARSNVFTGIFGKKIEIIGPSVKEEVEQLIKFSPEELEVQGYTKLFEGLSGKQSLSGHSIIQLCLNHAQKRGDERPLLYTYINQGDAKWTKILRPLTNILIYGFTDYDLEFTSGIQLDGFNVTAIPSAVEGFNSMRDKFIKSGYTSELTLEQCIESSDNKYDAVVTAYYENVPKDVYVKIMEKTGVFLAPFMKNFSRDPFLDRILSDVESKMFNLSSGFQDDDRPLARVLSQEKDISSGHRACSGCPIVSTFNLAMQSVRECYDTPEDKIELVNTAATGCAEVVTGIFPDTSWKKFLHTVFGGVGANLEGMNAAYRFLRKTGKITRQYKFFGWAGDGGTYDIGLQALSGYLERGLAADSVYVCYDNGAYMNTGIQRSSATPMGAGTTTTPIGEIIRGKPQFRKNLSEFAAAHEGVYAATVSIAFELDFKRKLQKAAKHDGPALIIAYSNCTTGHFTPVNLTVEQSELAVESGYWPLFEIENGEKKITYEPNFIRKYETARQKIQLEFKSGKKEKQQLLNGLEAAKKEYQDEFTENLAKWLRSEGRFALHFNKDGNLKNAESVALLLQLFEELKIEWNKLRLADREQRRKGKLLSVLIEYLRNKDKEERANRLQKTNTPLGINTGITPLEKYMDNQSYFDSAGTGIKESKARLFLNIRRQMDPQAYFEIYEDYLNKYNLDKPELTDGLRELAESLYKNYFTEQIGKAEKEQKAAAAQYGKLQKIKSRIKDAHNSIEYTHIMEEAKKQNNRAVLGAQPLAGRIFARAGDGGVTSAKLFVSLLGQIGIFGKAAPDYGPERRGAPVGTNFQLGGKELRTQAGYEELDISIVKDPADSGWSPKQWRDAVKDKGTLIVNTPLTPEKFRKQYNVPENIVVYTYNAGNFRKQNKVPETISLMAVALKSLSDKGVNFPKDYLDERWGGLLNKEFADKAKREQIVAQNKLALWTAFQEGKTDNESPAKPGKNTGIREFEPSPPEKLMTGSEAVAEAWRQINPGVFAMFPITPSTEVGQEFSKFWADGKVDTEYIHTESEHSSFMTIIAAAACGVRAVTSTASQGMLLGKEGGLLAATLRLPLVVNVGNRETNAPLSIHAGHTDAYQFRDDGWIQLFARNAQEAYDFAIIAQKIAEKARLPVFLNQDGFIVTHTKDMLNTLSDEQVNAFTGDYMPEDSLLTKDMTLNPISLQDYYSEHAKHAHDAQMHVPGIIDDVLNEFYKLSGRKYGKITKYELEDTDIAIVCMGSTEGTAMDAIDSLRTQGIKAGVLSIKTFRPFPSEDIKCALSKVKTIIVMDRMGSLGTDLTPLATEIKAVVMRDVINLEYGRGGRNTPRKLIEDICRIGVILGWHGTEKIDIKQIQNLLNKDRVLSSLLRELVALKGAEFVKKFKGLIAEGRFIEAFGPNEHIDVREKTKFRDIKLSVLERAASELTANGSNGKFSGNEKSDVPMANG